VNELREALLEEAQRALLAADLADVYRRADARARRSRRVATAVVLSLVVAVAGSAMVGAHQPSPSQRVLSLPPPAQGALSGIRIPGGQLLHGTLERRDPTADAGPWTEVVRADGGSFAHHGAVVTFPTGSPGAGTPITINGSRGVADVGTITWPIDGSYARVRGDLGAAQLAVIAAATTVVAGHPTLDRAPTGLRTASSGPYWPSSARCAMGPPRWTRLLRCRRG